MALRVGVMTFPTAYSMAVGELAAALEERGFESLWLTEHSHIPVERTRPGPGARSCRRATTTSTTRSSALAVAAEHTTTLRLGTAVLIMPQRDPIQLAKSLATIDVISGGRLEVGIGGGWNLAEMRNHGTDPARRFRRMREGAEAMVAIWTERRGRVPRRARRLRPDPGVAEARPASASQDPRRWRGAVGAAAGDPLRRRLDPDDRPRRGRTGRRRARAPAARRGRGPRPGRARGHHLRRVAGPRRRSTATSKPASTASCSCCRPRDETRSLPRLDRLAPVLEQLAA